MYSGCQNTGNRADKNNHQRPRRHQQSGFHGIHTKRDKGTPEALNDDSLMGRAFMDFARRVVEETDRRNAEQAPTHIVEVKK